MNIQIHVKMRKSLFLLLAASLLIAGCGTSKKYIQSNEDETVNTGYSRSTKEDLTYSVGHVKNKDTHSYNNIYDYFRDKVPGVRVEMTGANSAKIYIRGINSVNSPTDPMFIVDGVVVSDISEVNPYEVDSVDVLKDSAAAIYGVRGANGVIIINLKKTSK